jgi:AcrR family transcriptional regulator
MTRADAQRNRQRLLAAAREVFDEQGTGAPLDEIAHRAGIGNATLYRHFANRRELALAVYAEEVDALCARGAALLDADSPAEALFTWLHDFLTNLAARRELAVLDADQPGADLSGRYARWHKAIHRTASDLLDRARAAAAVHPDVEAADLLRLTSAIALSDADPHRLLRLARHGITPAPHDR